MAAKASMARHTSSCPPGGEFEFEFDINTKRCSGPMGSSWRLIRAHCGYGIVEHMSGDGRTALEWPPKPPWPAVCRLVRRHHFTTVRAWCAHERGKNRVLDRHFGLTVRTSAMCELVPCQEPVYPPLNGRQSLHGPPYVVSSVDKKVSKSDF